MKSSESVTALKQRTLPYQTLDAWRGVAALMVVAKHWSEVAVRHDPALGSHWLYQLSAHGGIGVQIFFVISGYCIANAAAANLSRNQGMAAYLWARARRIYPTYWAAVALMVVFTLAIGFLASRGMVESNIFANFQIGDMFRPAFLANLTLAMVPLGYAPFLIVAWTLSYEVVFYAIVAVALLLAYRIPRWSKERVLLNSLHALTSLTFVGLLIRPNALHFPLDLWSQFGLGVMVFDVLAAREGKAGAKIWLGVGIALCTIFALTNDVTIGFLQQPSRLAFLTTALFAFVLVIAHSWDARLASNPVIKKISILGVFSYSFYLTHFITVRVAGAGMQFLHLPVSLHYVAFVIALVVAIACGYVFFLLFEKPLLRSRGRAAAAATLGGAPAAVAAAPLSGSSVTASLPAGKSSV